VTPYDRGGYIGVDPVYQNAANETEQPMRQEEGAEAEVIKQAGHEKNVGKFDDESPLVQVDPENDPLVSDPDVVTGDNAPTPTGKAADEQKGDEPPAPPAPAKKTASSDKK
jgi:hypothetical protein